MSFNDPDLIAFRGHNRWLFNHPLEPLLRTSLVGQEFLQGPNSDGRGYRANWEVRPNHTLWLTGLVTIPHERRLDPGTGLGFHEPGPVPATWVKLCLRTPDTHQRRFSPIGNGSTYARESYLSVWRGNVVMIEETDGRTGRRIGGELTPHLESVFGSEESAFLRAAFADPDDAAPRLIYADWLDERHDPRATVIRLAERLRRADGEAYEPHVNRDVHRGQDHWLWVRVLGYHELATELARIVGVSALS
jgi:uncharacterized protein (TIGR02996 family)